MSNHLAAAAVTATLRKTLQAAVDAASPGIHNAKVTTLRPAAAELPKPGVNVFLYQVAPSGSLRNTDVPTRRADGSLAHVPQSALDLHYLISFTGDDAKLEPQFLLGITTRALHSQPVISRSLIESMLADPTFKFMQGADLQEGPELVRLTPVSLSLEDLSKLWSVVFQTPYVLSQVYRASVVFIDGTETARAPLRVARAAVQVNASLGPVLDMLLSQASLTAPVLADAPIGTGSYLVLVGRDLLTEVTRVRVGGVELQPDAASASATLLKVQIPATVPAGVQGVQVIQRATVAPSPTDTVSNALQFVLQPQITASFAAGSVTIGFTPPVGQFQRVVVLLNQIDEAPGAPPKELSFELPARTATAPATSLSIPVPGVTTGKYLVRVRVDGAESLLAIAPETGRYAAPQVSVP